MTKINTRRTEEPGDWVSPSGWPKLTDERAGNNRIVSINHAILSMFELNFHQ
jgi:hypothetical protein